MSILQRINDTPTRDAMPLPTETLRELIDYVQCRATTLGDAFAQVAVVSAAYEQASPSQRERLRTAASDAAGLLQRRKARSTGTTVSIYDREAAGVDGDGRFVAVCEDHGTMLVVDTLTIAKRFAPVPEEWCGVCRGDGG
jgi:hypothetical protein